MVDPIDYLLQNVVNPKLDATTFMVTTVGAVLFILWTITYFFRNQKLQTLLLDIHNKLKAFTETKRKKKLV